MDQHKAIPAKCRTAGARRGYCKNLPLDLNLAEVARHLPAKQITRNQNRLESLIEQRLAATGENRPVQVLKKTRKADFPQFRAEWINTRPSLRNVERLAREEGTARICL